MSEVLERWMACAGGSAGAACAPSVADLVAWLALGAVLAGIGLVLSRRVVTALTTLRARALLPRSTGGSPAG